MSEAYTITDQRANWFLTFQIIDWIDLFTRKSHKDVIVDALNFCVERKQLQVHAWVVMSNHVHCILSSGNGRLSDTVRDFKAFTARRILELVATPGESRREWILPRFRLAAGQHSRNEMFQVWTHENHAVYIDPFIPVIAQIRLNYIHDNPVRAGWVAQQSDYLYSSAVDYSGRKGLVKLSLW